jgi:hypothetical protein
MGIKVTLVSDKKSRISVNGIDRKYVRTVGIAPALSAVNNLNDLLDVDADTPDNNETLVYDEASGKYIVKTLPVIDGGTF